MNKDNWISVQERPLITKSDEHEGYWMATDDGSKEFLAAILVHDTRTGKDEWWIRHCVIEDNTGLCIVGDVDNDPAGWTIEDVQYYQHIEPPFPITQLNSEQ